MSSSINPIATSSFQALGKTLLWLGIAGFVAAIITNFTIFKEVDNGAIAGSAFLFIILGICFTSPDVLEDETGGLSTMRIIVLTTILVFGIITIKLAWNLKTFDEWHIDSTWVYILGLAFGGKAFQKYSEIEGAKNDDEHKHDMKLADKHQSLSREMAAKKQEEPAS